uniref:Mariner transposase n=1 Tax=Anopheles arabiensis TaxID=7173 RepID=A0A182HWZ5_ANOAR
MSKFVEQRACIKSIWLRDLVINNRRLTIRDLSESVGISKGSVNTILKDVLGLKWVKSRLVPKCLNLFEKQNRVEVCKSMLADYAVKMKSIITGDETWIYVFDPETTDQSSEYRSPNEPSPKKSRQSRSKIKVMLTVFFDYRGVVHQEFLPKGQTVNKEYYLSVMRRLRNSIRRKRPDLWKNNSWFLHHDNAPSHTAII